MHPTHLLTRTAASHLDACLARGIWIDFYDPDGGRYGLPTYPYHCAPDGLLTIRQLRDKGLRPGGQDHRRADLVAAQGQTPASPTSTASTSPCPNGTPPPPSWWRSAKALAARRTCPTCRTEKDYYIPRSTGECNDCTDGGHR